MKINFSSIGKYVVISLNIFFLFFILIGLILNYYHEKDFWMNWVIVQFICTLFLPMAFRKIYVTPNEVTDKFWFYTFNEIKWDDVTIIFTYNPNGSKIVCVSSLSKDKYNGINDTYLKNKIRKNKMIIFGYSKKTYSNFENYIKQNVISKAYLLDNVQEY